MSIPKKIVLVGHFGVGKSSLIRKFVLDVFSEDYKVTIGVHIFKKEITVENTNFTFIIWDIEGNEDIQKTRNSYLLGTSGFVYVIDPTRSTTFQNLAKEIDFITTNFPNAKIIKVANKADAIDRVVFEKELENNNLSIDFFTSAKTGENVPLIFEKMGLKFLKNE